MPDVQGEEMSLPRGIRNCNPGNIRVTKSAWQGKVPVDQNTDGAFEQFETMEYGLRALMKLIVNYMRKYRFSTIRQIINRWAPPVENNTSVYVNAVAKRVGLSPNEKLVPDMATVSKICEAICFHENGGSYVTMEQIDKAWRLL